MNVGGSAQDPQPASTLRVHRVDSHPPFPPRRVRKVDSDSIQILFMDLFDSRLSTFSFLFGFRLRRLPLSTFVLRPFYITNYAKTSKMMP